MVIVQRFFFFEFERGLTKCFEIVVYLFHYSVMIFLCIYSLKKNIAHVGQGALKLYVFACYLKLFSLNQYYLVSHLTKNHTILRNHTNHYKIKPLPYHTIWGPPVEITFIILFFCILTPNSSWNYYLYISGNSNGLWLNSLWFSAVFLKLF